MARFMEPAPGRTLVVDQEYAFAYDFGHRCAACEGEAVRRGTPALAVRAGQMSRPILERLGFEQVLQFRRLESVRS